MKEAYRILPVYAGDVSGIASALYELGGMVVIHDPSGCNSTYNTHDEIRWYDQESYIFISGLNMRDAVLGNDQKFIDDIVDAFYQLDPRPRFIAICNSPVPFLNGTDFLAVCRIVEKRCNVKTFYVQSNGMYDYVRGAGLAFLEYARNMLPAEKKSAEDPGMSGGRKIRVNVLGATPLTYGNRQVIPSLRELLEEDGFEVVSVWAMGSSPGQLDRSVYADANLVISDTGMKVAEFFQETYGIPYAAGVPVSEKSEAALADTLRRIGRMHREKQGIIDIDIDEYDSRTGVQRPGKALAHSENPGSRPGSETSSREKIKVFIGEAVLSMALAADCREKAYVLCPFAESAGLLGEELCACFDGEEELEKAIGDIKAENPRSEIEVFADPAYGYLLPKDVRLHALPSLALSGRMYQAHFPNYFDF